MFQRLVLVAAASLLLVSLGVGQNNAPSGIDLNALDRSANPCTDFFQYACGAWNAAHPIPADQSSWGRFNELVENNRRELRGILEKVESDTPGRSPVEREVGDFYAACMNTAAIDRLGALPLQPELHRIAAIQTRAALMAEVARLQSMGIGAMFRFGARQDFKNANLVIADADQGGLGLPDRDYYTRQDSKSAQTRQEYRQHVAHMFTLLGDTPATAAAEAGTVLSLETDLAQASLERAARRDPNKIYHKMTPAQFEALAPAVHWQRFFTGIGAPAVTSINVAVPDFFTALNTDLTRVPLAAWKTYLRWHLVRATAPLLSQPFVDANFDFYGKTLTGAL